MDTVTITTLKDPVTGETLAPRTLVAALSGTGRTAQVIGFVEDDVLGVMDPPDTGLKPEDLEAAIGEHDRDPGAHAAALSGKADLDPDTGTVRAEQLPPLDYEPAGAVSEHNGSEAAHPGILAGLEELHGEIELLKLQYATDVTGNSFSVTFDTLEGLLVAGVWNTAEHRIEF